MKHSKITNKKLIKELLNIKHSDYDFDMVERLGYYCAFITKQLDLDGALGFFVDDDSIYCEVYYFPYTNPELHKILILDIRTEPILRNILFSFLSNIDKARSKCIDKQTMDIFKISLINIM